MALVGKVVALTGTAHVENTFGVRKVLNVGDTVVLGDTISTMPGAQLTLSLPNGEPVTIQPNQIIVLTEAFVALDSATGFVDSMLVQAVINAIESGQDVNAVLKETAADNTGLRNSYGFDFVNLLRVEDEPSPLSFDYGYEYGVNLDDFPASQIDKNSLLAANAQQPEPIISIESIEPTVDGNAVLEGSDLVYTATLNEPPTTPVTFTYTLGGGTATAGDDFGRPVFSAGVTDNDDGTITVAAGIDGFTVTVPTVDDFFGEGIETVPLTIGGVTGTGTITDNDVPTFAVSSLTVSEPDAGFATFVISLSNPSSLSTTFNLALANGTAIGGGVDYGSSDITNLQVSTNSGAIWINATTVTIGINQTEVLVRTPIMADGVSEESETFTLTATRIDGVTTNESAIGVATITDVNVGPDAIDDVPISQLQEDTVHAVLTGNAILGGGGNFADQDANNDTLAITGAIAGAGAVLGSAPLDASLTVSGLYGNLQIEANGSYTYTLDNSRIQTQNLLGGETVSDVFTYKITDGNGGFDTATISVSILGSLDLTATTPETASIDANGLSGEYYGYNDRDVGGSPNVRAHADDRTATALGTNANIQSIEDVAQIINGRNAAMGGPSYVVGTSNAGAENAADVRFDVRSLNYGDDYGGEREVSGSLGSNPKLAAGASLPDYNFTMNDRELSNFLYTDAATAVVQTGTPVGGVVGAETGLGITTDAIIRMSGFAYLERGNYDFRVYADDGFRLKVGGETLIEFDGNQPPTTRTYENVEVTDLISGFTSIELLYWEQGGNANLQFEFKLTESDDWVPFSLDSVAFFSADNLPTITDARIQDVVESSINQQYGLRTGSVLDGNDESNTLSGGGGRDYIQGFGGDDTLNGNGGADYLDGGDGNDHLNGGAGADTLIGGAGIDTMTGGLGDDIYLIDGLDDIITEEANQGTDNIELAATFDPDYYSIPTNFENASLMGSLNTNVTGNAANNRITGNDGDNTLVGLDGNDRLVGGAGNDTLTGDMAELANGLLGQDIFEWNLADKGSAGSPDIDTITDFEYGGSGNGTVVDFNEVRIDRLDLRDLLVDEASILLNTGATPTVGNLLNYIDVSVNDDNTVLRISSTGGFSVGEYTAEAEDQRIVLEDINLYTQTGAINGNEVDLLQRMLANGGLVVD